jgi:F0F1-type ATP synthase assembly protein I
MKPDDSEPANEEPGAADFKEDEIVIPQVAHAPVLPPPPEIEFHRPPRALLGRGRAGAKDAYDDDPSAGSMSWIGSGMSIGVSFGLTVVVCIGAGMLIDQHVPAVRPWGTVSLSIIGIAAGLWNVMRMADILLKREKRR